MIARAHPPEPDPGTVGKAAALDIILPVEQRTRILRFDLRRHRR